ncbi:MAG: hypothetical protein R3E08_07520 [Thiotrichaceae bacterium]
MTQDQHEHVIYVSYADADRKWVIHFVNNLKVYLRKQLGKIDDDFIWARYMLRGSDNIAETTKQHIAKSKYMLTILSNAYLNDIGNTEIDLFGNIDNSFVVEHDQIIGTEKFKKIEGYYKFWSEGGNGSVVRLADPAPTHKEPEYYHLLDQIARDIVEKYEGLNDNTTVNQNIPEQIPSNSNISSPRQIRVFINATEEDRNVALNVQKQLGSISPLPYYHLSQWDFHRLKCKLSLWIIYLIVMQPLLFVIKHR